MTVEYSDGYKAAARRRLGLYDDALGVDGTAFACSIELGATANHIHRFKRFGAWKVCADCGAKRLYDESAN